MLKAIRKIHLYLGVFFAPLLLFYVLSGWYQTVTPNRNKTAGELGDWKSRLTQVHVDQIYPWESARGYSPRLFQGLVVTMAIALTVTVLLGIYLAFKSSRRRWEVWLCLALGVLAPIGLLWLGRR